ncbi:MAG: hypothetical protein AAB504_02075, partial [Patescibacteria group bacterium]
MSISAKEFLGGKEPVSVQTTKPIGLDIPSKEERKDLFKSVVQKYGQNMPPRIQKALAEAERANLEAEEAGSFGGVAKEFGKEFVKQAGEISGISPTGRRIAAGVAPYVVPEEELPTVVEELVGGVEGKKKIGVTGELAKKIGLPESVAE